MSKVIYVGTEHSNYDVSPLTADTIAQFVKDISSAKDEAVVARKYKVV